MSTTCFWWYIFAFELEYALSVHSQWGVLDNNFEVSNFSTEIKSCFFTCVCLFVCVRTIDTGYCKSANGNKMCMKRYFCRKLALNLWKRLQNIQKYQLIYMETRRFYTRHKQPPMQCNSILCVAFLNK